MASPHHQTARAVVCAAAVLLLSAPAALAGDPAPIASVSDRCTSGQDQRHYALPPQPVPFGATVARLTTAGAGTAWYPPGPDGADGRPAGAGFNIDVPGPGTYWMRAGSTNAGQAAFGEFHCPGSFQRPLDFQYTVDWFQAPSTPTTYAGSLAARGISEAVFLAPGAGQYVAQVAVSQGSVEVSYITSLYSTDTAPKQTVVTRGDLNFDVTKTGEGSVLVRALDGPPANWSVSVRARPVALTGPTVRPSIARQGTTLTIGYTLSGDAKATARVLDAGGSPVRTLAANLAVGRGQHSLRWDGFNSNGSRVRDGTYTVQIALEDNSDTPATKRATVVLDSTAPQIRVISGRRIARTRPLVIQPRDKTSGLRSARLIIGGRTVAPLVKGERRIIYRPRGGWRRSAQYRYQVVAVDRAGNKKTLRRTLSIK